jgi:hypothetical protein
MATQEEESSTVEGVSVGYVFVAVAASLLLGAYAAWITAAYVPRAVAFVFVAVGVGGTLYRQKRRDDGGPGLAYAGYVLSGLLVLTPVMMVLPDAASAGEYGVGVFEILFMTMNIVYFVVFGVLGAVVAYLSYRASTS